MNGRRQMMVRMALAAVLALAGVSLAGEEVQIEGSTTVGPIADAFVGAFQKMYPDRLRVWRMLPYLPALPLINEDWTNGSWILLWTVVRMVRTVCPERRLDFRLPNLAIVKPWIVSVLIACFLVILAIEPASSATIGTTIWHFIYLLCQ